MTLAEYFENTEGTGVLATADSEGSVDAAVYARPHFISENTVAFIMADKLSHRNLQSNPHAAYLFIEKQPGYKGKRLYLTSTSEEDDPQLVESMRRRKTSGYGGDSSSSVVYFNIDRVRPLVGD